MGRDGRRRMEPDRRQRSRSHSCRDDRVGAATRAAGFVRRRPISRAHHRADPERMTTQDLSDLPVTRLTPPAGWAHLNLGELREYRELVLFLIWRDVKVRYKQT